MNKKLSATLLKERWDEPPEFHPNQYQDQGPLHPPSIFLPAFSCPAYPWPHGHRLTRFVSRDA
jgi:hypothetical protein